MKNARMCEKFFPFYQDKSGNDDKKGGKGRDKKPGKIFFFLNDVRKKKKKIRECVILKLSRCKLT